MVGKRRGSRDRVTGCVGQRERYPDEKATLHVHTLLVVVVRSIISLSHIDNTRSPYLVVVVVR